MGQFADSVKDTLPVSSEKRADIIARCKKIVTPDQLKELSQLIDLLGDDTQHQGKYFILIDKLDENWIEDSLRFRLIRALIEALRNFRKIRRLKVVVALRTDVLERVVQETKSLGFQKEKYDDFICELRWTRPQLQQFLSDRVALLAKRHYHGQTVTLGSLLARKVEKSDPVEYMAERTLNRPRDVLAFFNQCLVRAAGKPEITATVIREAERDYSSGRFQALVDEWKGAFPSLPIVLSFLAQNGNTLTYSAVRTRDKCEDLVLRIVDDKSLKNDPLHDLAEKVLAGAGDAVVDEMMRVAVEILYRVGSIGVKPAGSDRHIYSHGCGLAQFGRANK